MPQTTTFDSKRAGHGLRKLVHEIIDDYRIEKGKDYGSRRYAAALLGLDDQTLYNVLAGKGVRETTVAGVCDRIGMEVAEFMREIRLRRTQS